MLCLYTKMVQCPAVFLKRFNGKQLSTRVLSIFNGTSERINQSKKQLAVVYLSFAWHERSCPFSGICFLLRAVNSFAEGAHGL